MNDLFTKDYLIELGFKAYPDIRAEKRCEDLLFAINDALIKEYPFLCLTTARDGSNHEATWLDLVPNGWRTSFMEDFCKELKKLLIKNKLLDDFYITDLSEKFGLLNMNSNTWTPELGKLQEKYEIKSMMHCQVCGEYTKYKTKGWIMYLCDRCYKEYTKNRVYEDDLLTWDDVPRWWIVTYDEKKKKQVVKHSKWTRTHSEAKSIWKKPKKNKK